MQARPVRSTGVQAVGAGQDRHAGRVQRADGLKHGLKPVASRRRAGVQRQGAALSGGQERGDGGIGRQLGGAPGLEEGLDDGEGRHDEDAGGRGRGDDVFGAGPVYVDVHQAVGAGGDGLCGLVGRADMEDRELAACARRGHDAGQCRRRMRRKRAASVPVLVDHLDVVSSLGDAGRDVRLGLFGVVQRRGLNSELRAVSARDGYQEPGREEIGPPGRVTGRLLLPPSGCRGRLREHVEHRRHPEVEGVLEHGTEAVGVGVDESRQQGHAATVDQGGVAPGRCRDCSAAINGRNLAAAEGHRGNIEQLVAVKTLAP